jgi:hypothetical protein
MRATVTTLFAAAILAATLVLPATAAASPAAGDFTTGPSCAVSCITSALIEPHTSAFGVTVRTDTPARIFVGVSTLLAPEGSWLDSTQSPPGRTSWAGHVSGLKPDTLYKVTVTATDATSRTERRTTYFLTRAVETALPGGPGDVPSGVDCSAQCISNVKLEPDATGAGLTVDTTVPAKLSISADNDAPGTIAGTPFFGTPEDTTTTSGFATHSTGALDRLMPGTNYHVILKATDAAGHISYRHGIFRTKSRRAKLVLRGIRVYYDGDKGGNRGELGFVTEVNQKYQSHLRLRERKVASGNWLNFPNDGRVDLAPHSRGLNLAVQARERDNAPTCSDQGAIGLWSPDAGKRDEWCNKRTWVTVRKVIDLDAPVPGSDQSPGSGGTGRHEFEILTSNTAGIRFVVYGHVDVRYT